MNHTPALTQCPKTQAEIANDRFIAAMLASPEGWHRAPGALASVCAVDGQNLGIIETYKTKPRPITFTTSGSGRFQHVPRMTELAHRVPAREIIQATSRVTGVPVHDFSSPRRWREIVYARFIAMHLMRQKSGLSLPQIGRFLGGRDHSTVHKGLQRVREKPETFNPIIKQVEALL